jgi:hypothetical protein
MTDLERRADVFLRLRPFLWCSVHKRTGECSIRRGAYPGSYTSPSWTPESGPFYWSPTRPAPRALGCEAPARDFPSHEYEWGHPDFQTYLRGYELMDERRAAHKRERDAA